MILWFEVRLIIQIYSDASGKFLKSVILISCLRFKISKESIWLEPSS